MSDTSALKTCLQCDKTIDSQVQNFLLVGKDQNPYHKSCLCCKKCEKPIDSNCANKEGKLYHLECIAPGKFPTCSLCAKVITGKHLKAGEKTFHTECYSCQFCQKIVSQDFFLIKKRPACDACWKKQAPACFVCEKPVVGKRFSAGGKYTFHPECYQCNHCQKAITQGSFVPVGHNVYHSDCFKETKVYSEIQKRKAQKNEKEAKENKEEQQAQES